MCSIVPKTDDALANEFIRPGDTVMTDMHPAFMPVTRLGNYVVICQHDDDGKWELTPEVKEGEHLEIPAGSKIKLVTENEWMEMNVGR